MSIETISVVKTIEGTSRGHKSKPNKRREKVDSGQLGQFRTI